MKRDEDEEKLLPTASSSSNKQQSVSSLSRCLSFSRLTIESQNVFKTIQNFLKKMKKDEDEEKLLPTTSSSNKVQKQNDDKSKIFAFIALVIIQGTYIISFKQSQKGGEYAYITRRRRRHGVHQILDVLRTSRTRS